MPNKIPFTAVKYMLLSICALSEIALSSQTKKNLTVEKQFETVLNHYKTDPIKLKAASFLIENLTSHKSEDCIWIDESGDDVGFRELEYGSFDEALQAFENIKQKSKIQPKALSTRDVSTVTSDYLIENIDFAVSIWRQNEWSQTYDFRTFREYVLPYRNLTEPLQTWREDYWLQYSRVKSSISDVSDPVEACTAIQKEMSNFIFLRQNRKEPLPLLGPAQLLFRKQGNCPDLANAILFACRANGIAATFDFTPFYAASSNSHFWNTVIDKQGNHVPFNGIYDTPGEYDPMIRRMAKVYRATFSINAESLVLKIPENEIPDGYLRSDNLIDVTNEYMDVGNVGAKFRSPSQYGIGYLSVFNLGKWREVTWAKMDYEGRALFEDMGRDVVYMPGQYINGEMKNERFPILLKEDGNQKKLIPNPKRRANFTFSRKNERLTAYNETNSVDIEHALAYTLLIWDNGWKRINSSVAKNSEVTFQNVPTGGLYLMMPQKPDGFERIFTFDPETNRISWY